MIPLPITAFTAISAMGRGADATVSTIRAGRNTLIPCDFAGIGRGFIGRVADIETHSVSAGLARFDCRNNRLAAMALHTDDFYPAVMRAREKWGAARVAVVLGTSTSGVLSGEDAYAARDPAGMLPTDFDHRHTQDLFSLADFVRSALKLRGPSMVISTACASSARAFGDAQQLIDSGLCDAAVVGGADSLCRMTLRGFAALDLVSDAPCRPSDIARSGVSIGEAAGFALLEREAPPGCIALLGHGSTSDGHHMSAPHPEAHGAIGAMRMALARAGLNADAIGYVNLHGTATRANDAMEDHAMMSVFGPGTPCSSTKGWSGHVLGAAGILDAVICLLCLRDGMLPACHGMRTVDPAFGSAIVTHTMNATLTRVMSNSFGFGGVNCSLLLGMP